MSYVYLYIVYSEVNKMQHTKTIKTLNLFCIENEKSILVRNGKLVGFSTEKKIYNIWGDQYVKKLW